MSEPERSEAELLARHLDAQNQHDRRALARKEGLSPHEDWRLKNLERIEACTAKPVEPIPPTLQRAPPVAAKILPPELLQEFNEILAEAFAAHAELHGLAMGLAAAVLAGDERVRLARVLLRTWAAKYVALRLARPSPRDRSQFARFQRIRDELVPYIDSLTAISPACTAFLGDLSGHISWLVFQGTWARHFELTSRPGLSFEWRLVDVPEEQRSWCRDAINLFAWDHAGDLTRFLEAARASGEAPTMPEEVARRRLEACAMDILEMRPLLLRGFNAAKFIVEPFSGTFLSWEWGGVDALGHLNACPTEREALESCVTGVAPAVLFVGYDGVLASSWARWSECSLDLAPDALALNVLTLEAFHARFLEIYAKVDKASLIRDGIARMSAVATVDDQSSDEMVAAVCQTTTDQDLPDSPAPDDRTSKRRVPGMRYLRFLASLREFGCGDRPGKGSHVVLSRAGRTSTIGHHTRNRDVPSRLVRRILSDLEIPLLDWMTTVLRLAPPPPSATR